MHSSAAINACGPMRAFCVWLAGWVQGRKEMSAALAAFKDRPTDAPLDLDADDPGASSDPDDPQDKAPGGSEPAGEAAMDVEAVPANDEMDAEKDLLAGHGKLEGEGAGEALLKQEASEDQRAQEVEEAAPPDAKPGSRGGKAPAAAGGGGGKALMGGPMSPRAAAARAINVRPRVLLLQVGSRTCPGPSASWRSASSSSWVQPLAVRWSHCRQPSACLHACMWASLQRPQACCGWGASSAGASAAHRSARTLTRAACLRARACMCACSWRAAARA